MRALVNQEADLFLPKFGIRAQQKRGRAVTLAPLKDSSQQSPPHPQHSRHGARRTGSRHQQAMGTGSEFPKHGTAPMRCRQSLKHPAEESTQL